MLRLYKVSKGGQNIIYDRTNQPDSEHIASGNVPDTITLPIQYTTIPGEFDTQNVYEAPYELHEERVTTNTDAVKVIIHVAEVHNEVMVEGNIDIPLANVSASGAYSGAGRSFDAKMYIERVCKTVTYHNLPRDVHCSHYLAEKVIGAMYRLNLSVTTQVVCSAAEIHTKLQDWFDVGIAVAVENKMEISKKQIESFSSNPLPENFNTAVNKICNSTRASIEMENTQRRSRHCESLSELSKVLLPLEDNALIQATYKKVANYQPTLQHFFYSLEAFARDRQDDVESYRKIYGSLDDIRESNIALQFSTGSLAGYNEKTFDEETLMDFKNKVMGHVERLNDVMLELHRKKPVLTGGWGRLCYATPEHSLSDASDACSFMRWKLRWVRKPKVPFLAFSRQRARYANATFTSRRNGLIALCAGEHGGEYSVSMSPRAEPGAIFFGNEVQILACYKREFENIYSKIEESFTIAEPLLEPSQSSGSNSIPRLLYDNDTFAIKVGGRYLLKNGELGNPTSQNPCILLKFTSYDSSQKPFLTKIESLRAQQTLLEEEVNLACTHRPRTSMNLPRAARFREDEDGVPVDASMNPAPSEQLSSRSTLFVSPERFVSTERSCWQAFLHCICCCCYGEKNENQKKPTQLNV